LRRGANRALARLFNPPARAHATPRVSRVDVISVNQREPGGTPALEDFSGLPGRVAVAAEAIVDAHPDDVVTNAGAVRDGIGTAGSTITVAGERDDEGVGHAAEIDVEIFKLGRPVFGRETEPRERGLDPAADRPPAARVAEARIRRRGREDGGGTKV